MSILDIIDREARKRGIRFLVIGGHAVNAHGYMRLTADVDLLVRKEDRVQWLQLLQEEGYRLYQDGGAFLQFSAPYGIRWPLDLMLVSEETFRLMLTDATMQDFGVVHACVPSLRHLLALKFHALKHGKPQRKDKDIADVKHLIRINELDVREESFRQLVEKYGTSQLYEELIASSPPE